MSVHPRAPTAERHRTAAPPYDVRVPVVVLVPQVAAVLALAGDAVAARTAFVLAVAVNGPLALAGRLPWALERRSGLPVTDLAVAVARPVAALLYAGTLLIAAPQSTSEAVHAAAWSSVVAAALLLVLPGDWTPAGRLVRARRTVGHALPVEIVTFVARRVSFAALLAVPWLAGYAGLLPASVALAIGLCAGATRPRRGDRRGGDPGVAAPWHPLGR